MAYRIYIPRPPLSDFVDMLWSYEGHDPPHARERVVPTGTMQLIVSLSEDELRVYDRQEPHRFRSLGGALLAGARSRFVVIDTMSQASTVGVHFKAGGAFPFLRAPADELRDVDVPLDALWGTQATELRERLLETRTTEARFRLLERALLTRVVRPMTHHPAVAFTLREFHATTRAKTIGEVGKQTGLSQRRFIELFRREVGLTPKLFDRIRRFQEVIRLLGSGWCAGQAEVALRCGYFDQAHLVHDFRAFSGTTPTDYLARRGEHPNHVSL